MKTPRTLQFACLTLLLLGAVMNLIGCGDPDADARAKKMENTIGDQRRGMSHPAPGQPQQPPPTGPGNKPSGN